ncbi:MAG: hypothetical protein IAF38_04375 [Bacteroidia bacterium]|nr:hypothetical protein [Bacteroidia bacterium]
MKKIILLAFTALAFRAGATDLIVQETGPVGTYPDILTAVTAAVDGDRIVINNRFGNAPWTGDITITKSLTFMSAAADTFFVVQGNYIIAPSAAGKTIKIIGMKNNSTAYGIYASAAAPAGIRTSVYITASSISGWIDLNQNNFNVTVAGNSIGGYVYFRFGKILGNYVGASGGSYAVQMAAEATATADTNYIVGNKINYPGTSFGVYSNSNTQYLYLANNFITTSGTNVYAVYTGSLNSFSSSGGNTIVNNTITRTSNVNSYGIYYGGNYTSNPAIKMLIANNLIDSYGTSGGYLSGSIYFGSTANNSTIIAYNFCRRTYAGYPDNGTNQYNLPLAFNANGLENNSVGVNLGDPNLIYNDLNQTRNDAGAYGGSFTLSNFFANHASTFGGGKNRVYFVDAPRQVIQGTNITIKGESYDR